MRPRQVFSGRLAPERRSLLRAAIVLMAVILLLLPGCAGRQKAHDGAEGGGGQPQQQGRKREESAAGALLTGAEQYMQAGRFDLAEMTLERALRLEPRNPRLWHEMARVKFGLAEYGQAAQFCLKSNSLAGQDGVLIKKNWDLLARAYEKMGEREKATQARMKARVAD